MSERKETKWNYVFMTNRMRCIEWIRGTEMCESEARNSLKLTGARMNKNKVEEKEEQVNI